jgi:hypothetical protein
MTPMQKAIASRWFVYQEDELSHRLFAETGVHVMQQARLRLDFRSLGVLNLAVASEMTGVHYEWLHKQHP